MFGTYNDTQINEYNDDEAAIERIFAEDGEQDENKNENKNDNDNKSEEENVDERAMQ